MGNSAEYNTNMNSSDHIYLLHSTYTEPSTVSGAEKVLSRYPLNEWIFLLTTYKASIIFVPFIDAPMSWTVSTFPKDTKLGSCRNKTWMQVFLPPELCPLLCRLASHITGERSCGWILLVLGTGVVQGKEGIPGVLRWRANSPASFWQPSRLLALAPLFVNWWHYWQPVGPLRRS